MYFANFKTDAWTFGVIIGCVLSCLLGLAVWSGMYGLRDTPSWNMHDATPPSMVLGETYHWRLPRLVVNPHTRFVYRVVGGALPSGVSFNSITGDIDGVLPTDSVLNSISLVVVAGWGDHWSLPLTLNIPVMVVQKIPYTGHDVVFSMPVSSGVHIDMWGAGGGASQNGNAGGGGAYIGAVLYGHVGDTYILQVGQGGMAGPGHAFGGGGSVPMGGQGGSGGGASSIFLGSTHALLALAAGGGGAGTNGIFGGPGGDNKAGGTPAMGRGKGVGVYGTDGGGPGLGNHGGQVDASMRSVGYNSQVMDGAYLRGGDVWQYHDISGAGAGGAGVYGGSAGSDVGAGGGGGGASFFDGVLLGCIFPGHGMVAGNREQKYWFSDIGMGGDDGHNGGNGYIVLSWKRVPS